jgi:hypothetical protein
VSDLKLICHIGGSQTETSLFTDLEASGAIAETETDERAGRRGRERRGDFRNGAASGAG